MTVAVSFVVCVVQVISGDVTTGTVFIILTGKTVPVGKKLTRRFPRYLYLEYL